MVPSISASTLTSLPSWHYIFAITVYGLTRIPPSFYTTKGTFFLAFNLADLNEILDEFWR
jgi:hypothetical protein